MNFDSKVNAMTLAFTARLGFTTRLIGIGAQNIDSSTLKT